MVNPNRFYTYAYLRKDRTPYYIGKGAGNRVYSKNHNINLPPKERILFLKQNLTEEEAFKHEKYMITLLGRKDLGTGILHNKTDGGEGASGFIHSEDARKRIGQSSKGRGNGKTWWHDADGNSKRCAECPGEGWVSGLGEKLKSKISKSKKGENNYWYGKNHSSKSKQKMSESRKGENSYWYGRKLSQETKKKLSEIQSKKRWWNDGNGNRKFCVEIPGEGWVRGKGKKISVEDT